MGARVVVTDGDVLPETAGLAGSSTVVGAAPQWSDDLDTTYGRVTTWTSALDPVTAYNACTSVLKQGAYTVPTGVKVRMRLAAETSDVPMPSKVHIYNPILGSIDCLTVNGPATLAPTVPTWVEWTFAPVGGGYADLVAWLASGQALVRVQAGLKFGPSASGVDEFRYTRIYEVIIVLEGIPTVAPPCRIFPREDGLGVGGGRSYPPPKSQQRSGRQFGYY